MKAIRRERKRLPGLLLGVMDGGSLEQRVLRLMDHRLPWAQRGRLVAAASCVAVMVVASAGIGGFGVHGVLAQKAEQGSGKPMVFAVATIKPSDPKVMVMGYPSSTAESFIAKDMSLQSLIGYAYEIPTVQSMTMRGRAPYDPDPQTLDAVPAWVRTEKFDVTAKADEATVAAWNKLTPSERKKQVRLMLQALLTERFKLSMRHETRVLPAYELVVAKGGAKLQPTPPEPTNAPAKPDKGLAFGPGGISVKGMTVSDLASMMWVMRELGGHKVVDKTGLQGKYDINLKWVSEDDASSDGTGPSLFTAMQEQLGLKLNATQMPMDVSVIAHVERPSEN